MGIGMDQHQHLGYLWVGSGGVDFGLDRRGGFALV